MPDAQPEQKLQAIKSTEVLQSIELFIRTQPTSSRGRRILMKARRASYQQVRALKIWKKIGPVGGEDYERKVLDDGHGEDAKYARKQAKAAKKRSPASGSAPATSRPAQRRPAVRVCYVCKEPGHLAEFCPQVRRAPVAAGPRRDVRRDDQRRGGWNRGR